MRSKFVLTLTSTKESLIASRNMEEFGINLIGSQLHVLEIIKPLILEENLNVLEPFLDYKENFFATLENWNLTEIYGLYLFSIYGVHIFTHLIKMPIHEIILFSS